MGHGITRKAGVKRLPSSSAATAPCRARRRRPRARRRGRSVQQLRHQGQICMATNRVIVEAAARRVRRPVPRGREALRTATRHTDTVDRPGHQRPAARGHPGQGRRPVARARRAALVRRAGRPGAPACLRTSSSAPTTSPPPPRRYSARCAPSSAPPTKPTHCGSPTTRPTACPAPSSPETSTAASPSPLAVEAGMTHVNDTTVHDDVHVAFGGEKQSVSAGSVASGPRRLHHPALGEHPTPAASAALLGQPRVGRMRLFDPPDSVD